jgi:hypothetical protein
VDERKQVEEWIAKIDAEEMSKEEEVESATLLPSSSTPEHSLEEKQSDESFKTKKKKKQHDDLGSMKIPSLEDCSGQIEGSKRRESPVSTSKILVTDVDHKLRLMSFKDILDSAMSHYSSVLKMRSNEKKTGETLFITTSSLSDKEQRVVKKMTQRLSTGKGEFCHYDKE